jgi:hypothetical protein
MILSSANMTSFDKKGDRFTSTETADQQCNKTPKMHLPNME